MIRTAMLAAAALSLTCLWTAPATAQSVSQNELEERYDRALAAGYKALFLCSAIANAELFGAERSVESVARFELTGIQTPLDAIEDDLEFQIARGADGVLDYVLVPYADDMPPRVASHRPDRGCVNLPMGVFPTGFASYAADLFRPIRETARVDSFDEQNRSAEFSDLASSAFDARFGADARTTAVVLLHDGVLVGESYGQDHGPLVPQRTWSVAKSIASTLVGAAVHRGEADVMASAGLGVADSDPRRRITIDALLRMASGRYSDTPGNQTDPLYFGGSTVMETAAHWPMIHPYMHTVRLEHAYEESDDGLEFVSYNPPLETRYGAFRYANNDTLMAVMAIDGTFADNPPSASFEQWGMDFTIAETDWQGNYILSSQVWSTARDLARLGQLYLNDGVLPDGTRILPEGWVEYVSTPSGPQPDGTQWGYGAGWWLMGAFEGIPEDAIAARGNRGQFIVVIPSADLVIVRRGEDPAGGSGFDIVAFTRDVLAALAD